MAKLNTDEDYIKFLKNIDSETYKEVLGKQILLSFYTEEITPNSQLPINLKTLKSPIYYLYDGYINSSIGSNSKKLKSLNNLFGIDLYFKFDQISTKPVIYHTNNPSHATLFYHMKYNNKYYLFYSNSGLGIENHINLNGCVFPNIYIYNTDDSNIDIIYNIINLIYTLIKYLNGHINNFRQKKEMKRTRY